MPKGRGSLLPRLLLLNSEPIFDKAECERTKNSRPIKFPPDGILVAGDGVTTAYWSHGTAHQPYRQPALWNFRSPWTSRCGYPARTCRSWGDHVANVCTSCACAVATVENAMNEASHPLVAALGHVPEGVEKVYLPPTATPATRPEQSESVAMRPNVRAVAEAYYGSTDALHGDRVPDTTIQTERPIHRMMIYLHAMGASIRDIAKQTGYSYASVSQILRQPWARQRLIQILNECGRDQVKHFLSNEIAPSLEVLREVRDDVSTAPNVRVIAADKILDRALGKATVHVESNSTMLTGKIPDEVARIDADLRAVREQLSNRGVTDVGTSN